MKTALANSAAASHGVPLDAFCDFLLGALADGAMNEIGYGPTARIEHLSCRDLDALFEKSAGRFEVPGDEGGAVEGAAPGLDPE